MAYGSDRLYLTQRRLMSTKQLLPAQDLTFSCRLTSLYSIVDSSSRQMLPNRISARLCITASRGIAPDRMYTAGSVTVCGCSVARTKSDLRISYVVFLSYLMYTIGKDNLQAIH